MSVEISSIKRKIHRGSKTFAGVFAIALVASIVSIVGTDSAIANDGLYSKTYSKTLPGIKSCPRAYSELRSRMKFAARKQCVSKHHSPKLNTLGQEHFTKISCQKKKEGRKTVSVKVKGTLTYLCN